MWEAMSVGYCTKSIAVKSSNEMKKELCACLLEINDVNPNEMFIDEWMDFTDRGGLKHITNYMLFLSIELVLRKHFQGQEQPSLIAAKDKVVEEDILFYWSIITSNWEQEPATTLLKLILDQWITIRGH